MENIQTWIKIIKDQNNKKNYKQNMFNVMNYGRITINSKEEKRIDRQRLMIKFKIMLLRT